MPLGATKADWLSVVGEKERDFKANETHPITIRIQPPAGTAPGKYSCRLNMIAVHDPERDFTEGAELTFEVKGTTPPPPTNWTLIVTLLVVGLVLVGGAITVFLLLPKKLAIPNVVGKPSLEASNLLASAQFTVTLEEDVTGTNRAGTVFTQSPLGGQKAKAGSTIVLTAEGQPITVKVPDVLGMPVSKVKELIEGKGLKHAVVGDRVTPQNPPPAGTIVAATPAPGSLVELGATLNFTVEAPSVEVPDVRQNLALSVAINRLAEKRLAAGRIDQQIVSDVRLVNLVVGQDPPPGTRVKTEDKVVLRIGVVRRISPIEWDRLIKVSPHILKATPAVIPR
jgi:beta-lactam-binding protein with PASTA domain